jgi:hypothetical protein
MRHLFPQANKYHNLLKTPSAWKATSCGLDQAALTTRMMTDQPFINQSSFSGSTTSQGAKAGHNPFHVHAHSHTSMHGGT